MNELTQATANAARLFLSVPSRDPASVARSIYLSVSYNRPATSRDAISRAIDGGFDHLVLGLPSPYPAGVTQWVVDELITTTVGS